MLGANCLLNSSVTCLLSAFFWLMMGIKFTLLIQSYFCRLRDLIVLVLRTFQSKVSPK